MVKETNSGVREEGSWSDISKFAKQALQALKDSDLDDKYVEEYETWMPKEEGDEREIKEKTAEDAVLNHREVEDKSEGVKKDLDDASKKIAEAGKKAAKKERPDEEVKDASVEIADLVYAKSLKFARRMEKLLYSKIMMRFNPYYLDTEEFSVDLKHKKTGGYTLDINIPREQPRKDVKKKLKADQNA